MDLKSVDTHALRQLGDDVFIDGLAPVMALATFRRAANELDSIRFGPNGPDLGATWTVLCMMKMCRAILSGTANPCRMWELAYRTADEIERLRKRLTITRTDADSDQPS